MVEKSPATEAAPGLDDIRQDLERLRADLASLVENVGRSARQVKDDAVDAAGAQAQTVGDWAEECGMNLRETIREQPLTACAVAAGIGIILGQVLLRR